MKFIIEPYSINFEVYYTSDPKRLVKSILKRKPDLKIIEELRKDWIDLDAGASVCAGQIRGNYTIIAIFDKEAIKDYHESYLAHEAVHVLSYVMKYTGIKYDFDNDEPHAYIVDGIVQMMVRAKS